MLVCSGSHSGWLILPVYKSEKMGATAPAILLPLLRNIKFDNSFCISVVCLSHSSSHLAGIMTIVATGENLILSNNSKELECHFCKFIPPCWPYF